MAGPFRIGYADDLALGVRGRPPHKPVTNCRSYPDEESLGVRSRPGTQECPPHKPTSNCRAYPDDLPCGE